MNRDLGKVLVVGGDSHLAVYLLPELVRRGVEVTATSRRTTITFGPRMGVNWTYLNCVDVNLVDELKPVRKFDTVIYLASHAKIPGDRATHIMVNYVTPTLMLAALGEGRFIYMSTPTVLGNNEKRWGDEVDPLSEYATTKAMFEQATVNDPRVTCIRGDFVSFHKGLLYDGLLKNKTPYGYTNVMFNPVSTQYMAKSIIGIIERRSDRVVQVGSSSVMPKFDLLQAAAHLPGLQRTVAQALYGDGIFQDRPLTSVVLPDQEFTQPTRLLLSDIVISYDEVPK